MKGLDVFGEGGREGRFVVMRGVGVEGSGWWMVRLTVDWEVESGNW